MDILLWKLSDERHRLELRRVSRPAESVECETRSYLLHDLRHYAVESEAHVTSGFWGRLADGASLAVMNDRTRTMDAEMASIEQVVGALTPGVRQRSAAEVVAGLHRFASSGGATWPAWLTEELVVRVEERMRQLVGRWKATPRGRPLELAWPGCPPSTGT